MRLAELYRAGRELEYGDMVASGYPLGRWGVAADRRSVHEVSSRNRWGDGFGAKVPKPLWPPARSG